MGFPGILLEANLLDNPGAGTQPGTWDDITEIALGVSVKRGRNSELDRFETGTFQVELANKNGFIEVDGSTVTERNVFTPNQASFETDSSGWAHNTTSAFITSVAGSWTSVNGTGESRYGNNAFKYVATGVSLQGVHTNNIAPFATVSGRTYVGSIWARGAAGGEAARIGLKVGTAVTATVDITLSRVWQRFSTPGAISDASGANGELAIYTRDTSAPAWYWDGAMVESTLTVPSGMTVPTPYSENGGGAKSYRPGNKIRFTGYDSKLAVVRRLFTGVTEGWKPAKREYRYDAIEMTAIDAWGPPAPNKFTGDRPQERTDQRIAAVLNAIGWSSADRVLDVGQTSMPAITYDRADSAQILYDAMDAEQGQLYVDNVGRMVFENRYKRSEQSRSVTSQGTFDDLGADIPYEDIEVEFDWNRVLNEVTVEREGGTPQTREDATSQGLNFVRSYSRKLSLVSDAEADSIAQYILARYKDVLIRVTKIVLDPTVSDNAEAAVLRRDISDRVTIKFRVGSTEISGDYFIESVKHDIRPGKTWRTTWALSPASIWQFWVLGDSVNGVLGSTTRVGF